MATSWLKNITCFQCHDTYSCNFRNGWRLRNGQFAQLCNPCASLYEAGRFCEYFHSTDEGWTNCEFCHKFVHCGCIAAFHTFMLLDFGGVTCMDCWKRDVREARKQGLLSETTENEPLGEQVVEEITMELLFEKLLSASDADHNLGRIILPKKGAEAYFPKITAPSGCSVIIQDTEGKEWEFQFRYWTSGCYKTYFLEGMKDFMELKQWQAGDTAMFHRIVPGENMVIGLRKKNYC